MNGVAISAMGRCLCARPRTRCETSARRRRSDAETARLCRPRAAERCLPGPSHPPPARRRPAPAPQGRKARRRSSSRRSRRPSHRPRPTRSLKVAPPKPFTDPGLAAFRKELTAIAQTQGPPGARQARAGAGLLLAEGKRQRRRQEDRHRGARDRAQPRRQGRLGLGVALANSPPTKPPRPIRTVPNTVCSPAGPEFNPQELEKLAEATKTDLGDWGFTVAGRRRGARHRDSRTRR